MITFLAVSLLVYAGFCTYLYIFQRSLMYFPRPRWLESAPVMELQRPDAKVLVTVEEREGPDAIIYFGGNSEDTSYNLPDFIERFPSQTLFLMHYRGYGGSEGKPSEKAIMEDAFALFDEVSKKYRNIAVAGRSLGSGIAVRLAAKRPVSKVVLITPYDSIERVASRFFPYVPVKWILEDKYESWRYAPDVSAPTLILVAERDEVIPEESSRRLYEQFPKGIALLRVIPEARHNSISHSGIYKEILADFLNTK